MKYLIPLLLLFLSFTRIVAQPEPLNLESFVPIEGKESGTASVSGSIDNTTNELNLEVNWNDFSSPMADVFIHMGSTTNPGASLLRLRLRDTEITTDGQIGRLIIGDQLPAFTKDQSKAQVTRRIEISQFDLIADAIEANDACIILQVQAKDGSLRSIFAAPLSKAAAVPTMSQWAILILALMISSLALIYIKRRSTTMI